MQMPPSESPNAALGLVEAAKWTGVYVYTGYPRAPWVANLALGQRVQLTAQVNEYQALTELWHLTSHVLLFSPPSVPIEPVDITTGTLGRGACQLGGEAYEGVLVRLTNVRIRTTAARNGTIVIDDGSGAAELQDDIFDTDAYLRTALCGGFDHALRAEAIYQNLPSHTITTLVGIVREAGGAYAVYPRFGADVVLDGPPKGSVGCAALEASAKLADLWNLMHNGTGDTPPTQGSLDDVLHALGYTRTAGSALAAGGGGDRGTFTALFVVENLVLVIGLGVFLYLRCGKRLRGRVSGLSGGMERFNGLREGLRSGMRGGLRGGMRSRTSPSMRTTTISAPLGTHPPAIEQPYEAPSMPLAQADASAVTPIVIDSAL